MARKNANSAKHHLLKYNQNFVKVRYVFIKKYPKHKLFDRDPDLCKNAGRTNPTYTLRAVPEVRRKPVPRGAQHEQSKRRRPDPVRESHKCRCSGETFEEDQRDGIFVKHQTRVNELIEFNHRFPQTHTNTKHTIIIYYLIVLHRKKRSTQPYKI